MKEAMQNDQPLDGKYLGTISSDFVKVADQLKEAAYVIGEQQGYAYPIFPMAKVPLPLGALFIDKGEVEGNQWCYYAAYLEVLLQCGLVGKDKAADFKQAYKDLNEFCCLLVVDECFTKFVYIPYPVEEE